MELKGLLKKTDSKKCVKIFEFALKNVKYSVNPEN